MITPITKIAAEVVRQAAQHPNDTPAQIYQRVAAEAMQRSKEGQPA